jgi:hypothetical protein
VKLPLTPRTKVVKCALPEAKHESESGQEKKAESSLTNWKVINVRAYLSQFFIGKEQKLCLRV